MFRGKDAGGGGDVEMFGRGPALGGLPWAQHCCREEARRGCAAAAAGVSVLTCDLGFVL